MLNTLKIPSAILVATGDGWVVNDGPDNYFVNYRLVHGTNKVGDDYLLKFPDHVLDAPELALSGLRKFIVPA